MNKHICIALLSVFSTMAHAQPSGQTLPPAIPFDGHSNAAVIIPAVGNLPPPPPPTSAGYQGGSTAVQQSGAPTVDLRVVLSMGPVATVQEYDQSGKATRTTIMRDGGSFTFQGQTYKLSVKDGAVTLMSGGKPARVLDRADSIPVDATLTAQNASAYNAADAVLSAGDGVKELTTGTAKFSASTGSSNSMGGSQLAGAQR